MKINIDFMKEAIAQAKIAFKKNEVPVGAIIVKNGEIISKAHNQNIAKNDSTAHAEILAIRDACKKLQTSRLDDCDIYVTLEPCQMCLAAISLSHLKRLYYATGDSKFGAIENNIKITNPDSPYYKSEIYSGIYEEEPKKLLQDFFKSKRK